MTLRVLLPFEDCARPVYKVWPGGDRPSDEGMVLYCTPDFFVEVALKEKVIMGFWLGATQHTG